MGSFEYPCGFRFVPTDNELALYYLRSKLDGLLLPPSPITECDVYGDKNPWELFDHNSDECAYVFTKLKKRKKRDVRILRIAGSGTWKARNKTQVRDKDGRVLWFRKDFLFEVNKKNSLSTDNGHWLMTEFSLHDEQANNYVLCKIWNKHGRNSHTEKEEIIEEEEVNALESEAAMMPCLQKKRKFSGEEVEEDQCRKRMAPIYSSSQDSQVLTQHTMTEDASAEEPYPYPNPIPIAEETLFPDYPNQVSIPEHGVIPEYPIEEEAPVFPEYLNQDSIPGHGVIPEYLIEEEAPVFPEYLNQVSIPEHGVIPEYLIEEEAPVFPEYLNQVSIPEHGVIPEYPIEEAPFPEYGSAPEYLPIPKYGVVHEYPVAKEAPFPEYGVVPENPIAEEGRVSSGYGTTLFSVSEIDEESRRALEAQLQTLLNGFTPDIAPRQNEFIPPTLTHLSAAFTYILPSLSSCKNTHKRNRNFNCE